MKLAEFIRREVKLAKESRHPNALSMRFVQLHEQESRSKLEEQEYRMLYCLMKSRWRWYQASLDVIDARREARRRK